MADRPILLDAFCGAGGAAVGYHRGGFDVVGVDIAPQPNYPFEFHQEDAVEFIAREGHRRFAAIHASPTCQHASTLRHRTGKKYVNLIPPTRAALSATGLPYVIENVVGAELIDPVTLCGSSFGLGAGGRQLRRHRLFECSGFFAMVLPCNHQGEAIGVYGNGGAWKRRAPGGGGYQGTAEERREAMGIDWMGHAELSQAIPPAYTEHLAGYLMAAVKSDG